MFGSDFAKEIIPAHDLNDVHLKGLQAKWEPIVVMEEMCQLVPEYYGVNYPTVLEYETDIWGKSYFVDKGERPNFFIKEIEKFSRYAIPLIRNITIMFKFVATVKQPVGSPVMKRVNPEGVNYVESASEELKTGESDAEMVMTKEDYETPSTDSDVKYERSVKAQAQLAKNKEKMERQAK
jgi:hypothetical protein